MTKEDLRIVFMGTPDFALESLKALVENGFNVVGVFSKEDKPKGRGMVLSMPPTKEYALDKNIPVEWISSLIILSKISSLSGEAANRKEYNNLLEVDLPLPFIPPTILSFPKLISASLIGPILLIFNRIFDIKVPHNKKIYLKIVIFKKIKLLKIIYLIDFKFFL